MQTKELGVRAPRGTGPELWGLSAVVFSRPRRERFQPDLA